MVTVMVACVQSHIFSFGQSNQTSFVLAVCNHLRNVSPSPQAHVVFMCKPLQHWRFSHFQARSMFSLCLTPSYVLFHSPSQRQEDGVARLKRVILIGDHHQLPPVVQNMAFQKYSHLDQPLFTRFIRLGTPYVELDAQGRARPSIAKLYNWRYRHLGDLPYVLQVRTLSTGWWWCQGHRLGPSMLLFVDYCLLGACGPVLASYKQHVLACRTHLLNIFVTLYSSVQVSCANSASMFDWSKAACQSRDMSGCGSIYVPSYLLSSFFRLVQTSDIIV